MSIEKWQRDPGSLYRLAVDQATDYVIFLLDADARICTWAPAVGTMFGWSASEFVERAFSSLFPDGSTLTTTPDAVLAEAASEGRARYTAPHVRRDGTEFWAHGRVARIDDAGTLCGFVVSLQDVTAARAREERQRDEAAALRQRVAEFEALLEVVPIGIGIAQDAAGTNVRVNRAFARMLRIPEDANASLSAPEGERPSHFRVMREGRELTPDELPLQVAARTGRPVGDFEVDVVFDTGEHVRLLEQASPLLDESGSSRGSVGAFIDVTERAAAEAHFRRLADSAPVLIWTASLDQRRNWFNKPWLDFTGRTLDAERGDGWADGIHPDDREGCLAAYEATLAARREFRHEYRLLRHDGVYRWLLDIGTPAFDRRGELTGYIGTCVDMTGRKEYEEQRERLLAAERDARQEAERVNKIKDEFLASLSHEVRTPLNAILGWSQMLQEMPDMPAQARRGLGIVERNARLQALLLEDLLDMSRILSGKLHLDIQQVSLVPIVEEAVASILPSAQAKDVRVVTALNPRAGLVAGDPVRLQQILWNLLSNAVKFSAKGGQVRVALERRHAEVELSVTDTGIGIPADFLPHVFDPFRQADGSTTRSVGGLGLGLSIVKHLGELHGGTVRARSIGPEQGSTFTVSLPEAARRTDAAVRRGPAREGTDGFAVPSLVGLTVLVVEDHEDSRTLLAGMLEECGATVEPVDSVQAALHAIRQAPPDVIITDIGLPVEDGYGLIRAVRAMEPPLHRIPALALTAYARSEDRRLALLAGFQLHMAKPVDFAELCTAVASLAGRL